MTVDSSSAPRSWLIAGEADAPALHTATETINYGELAKRVSIAADALGDRQVRVVRMGSDLESVIALLAALQARHPVVLVPAEPGARQEELTARYEGAERSHPDLALLLSTSGSTGSPKLVRLSHDNLHANATSIAAYLGLRPSDVGITTLPLYYCYGLSVLTSHLAVGASVVLTDHSVADDCFWDLLDRQRVTGFAGVPFTFDQLDRVGFDGRVTSLRYLTQAGGRMEPEQVRKYADLGRRRGFDLFVMYGQTEATARMAYLPQLSLRLDRRRSGSRSPVGRSGSRKSPAPKTG